MGTVTMDQPIADAHPLLRTRLAAFFYVLAIVAGAVTFLNDGRVMVHGNAAATAANLLALEPLVRISLAASLTATAACIGLTVLLYRLLTPVDRRLSFVAAFLSAEAALVGVIVSALHLGALLVAKGSHALSVPDAQPLRLVILRLLELNSEAATMAVLFFAVYSFVVGYLVYKSTFLPRTAGALTLAAGLVVIAAAAAPYVSTPVIGLLSACARCLAHFS